MFRPNVQQLNTEIRVLKRHQETVNGAAKVSYPPANPEWDKCSWKGRGGSESIQSGTLVVEDTAELTMWFRQDITEKDRIELCGKPYDVMNVENIEQRGIYMLVKVRRAVNA